MIHTRDINIRMIIDVAKRLGDLRDKVVFVGGCATGLFITDPAIPEVRATQDVDKSLSKSPHGYPITGLRKNSGSRASNTRYFSNNPLSISTEQPFDFL